ncbi:MAG: hypothetical protein KF799_15390 [Bdellovibrionales bacterium]|nr:hypothetical protein [Bdellovibrionales bacterium]
MRILRGKSNLEVSSQGFALFVVGLVLATFLGGAVRTILSSERVHSRIVTELQSRFPRNEFQIGRTEVLLSRGLWPGLGLRLRDVVFRQDVCGKLSFELTIPQAVLPVDLLSLRHGQVRLGTVSLTDARMHLDYHDCPPKSADVAVPTSQGIRSAVAEKGIKPPTLDWQEVSRALGGMELTNFQLTYERNITWKLILKSAEMYFDDDMHLQATMDVQKSFSEGALNHAVNLEAHGEGPNVQWRVRSEFKEGQVQWSGTWDLARNSAHTDFTLVQIPLKDLSSELYQMGFVGQEIKLKTAWLTCKGAWDGQVDHLDATPLRLSACKVEGAYGRVELEQADWFLSSVVPFKVPAQFHVQKLQVQPLIESLGRQLLPAVLARVGVWTGVVDFSHSARWSLDGSLENAEIVFSNQSLRGKQLIRKAHTKAERNGAVIDARLSGVEMQNGEFSGQVGFALTEDGRSGTFDVQIDRLVFSPAIQNILIGGNIAPVKLNGKGALLDGELSQWNGTFNTAELSGEGWRTAAVEIKSKYSPGVFHVEVQARELSANTRWRPFTQLRGLRGSLAEAMTWKDLNARVDIAKNGGTLSSLSAIEESSSKPWRVRGSWLRDGVFTGTLLAGGPQAFALRGEKGSLSIHDRQPGDSP